jgi:hypothetical protein
MTTLAAYYYPLSKHAQKPGAKGVLELAMIEPNGTRHNLTPWPAYVAGVRDARQAAKAHGATPWNF